MTSSVISETGCKDTDFFHLSKLFYIFFHFFVFTLKNSPDLALFIQKHENINGKYLLARRPLPDKRAQAAMQSNYTPHPADTIWQRSLTSL